MDGDENDLKAIKQKLGTLAVSGGRAEKWMDITEDFIQQCKEIPFGELALAKNFYLSEAMSAIELMDPKMDVGLVKINDDLGLEKCRREGAFSMSLPDTLATLDASLAALVTWFEGNSLAQTLWTNVLLTEPKKVDLPVLGPFGHSMALLIHYVINIIQTAGVFDEEDFNGVLIYRIDFQKNWDLVSEELQTAESSLMKEAKNSPNEQILKAMAARLGFVRTFIQGVLFLTPVHAAYNNEGEAEHLTTFRDNIRPKLRQGGDTLKLCLKYAEKIKETWRLGSRSDAEDDDFGWLPAFEPDLNRKYLPPTFPRKSEIIPRSRAIPYLVEMVETLLRVPTELPEVVHDVSLILEYARSYSEAKFSTVFTRSFLQMVLFPVDDHVLGDRSLADICCDSLKNGVSPPFLDPSVALLDDEEVQLKWAQLSNDLVRVLLAVLQTYGSNLSRQREKLVPCIEDLCVVESEADALDVESLRACSGQKVSPSSYNLHGGLHVATFVINELLRLLCVHMEHSFRLQLVAPYEYTYMYWYLGEIGKKWLCHGNERAYGFLSQELKNTGSPDKKRNDKKTVMKVVKKEEKIKKRLQMYKDENGILSVEISICDGMFRTAIALILLRKIEVPMWNEHSEELRFTHRMAPFAQLYSLFNFDYKTYKQRSKFDSLASAGPVQLLHDAIESFEMARLQLERSHINERFAIKAESMMKVCKNNIVVLRILASGQKRDNRINFDFTESPIYPMIRLQ